MNDRQVTFYGTGFCAARHNMAWKVSMGVGLRAGGKEREGKPMMKSIQIPAFALAYAVSFASAEAATLTITSVVGEWTSVQKTAATTNIAGLGTSEISWGTALGSGGHSGYAFAGLAPSGPFVQDGDFDLGLLTHQNQPIAAGTSILGATLTVMIEMLIDGTLAKVVSQFDFDHVETPNAANPCADGGANGVGVNIDGCADHVTATTNFGKSDSYIIDRVEYFVDVTGFLSDGSPMTQFWTVEGLANTAILQARFSAKPIDLPVPIPVPATALMLLAGMGGLAALRARRRKV